MPRRTSAGRRSRRIASAVALAATLVAGAVPARAAPTAMPADVAAFAAGYREDIGDKFNVMATLVVPRADACDLGDGSVTMQVNVAVGGESRVGAEVTSTCEDGAPRYTGSWWLGGGDPYRLYGKIRGGDWLTVQMNDTRYQTDVGVSSVRGWGEGGATRTMDLRGAVLTVGSQGELSSAESAGGLAVQRYRYLRVKGKRFGSADPEAFGDECSTASALRHKQAFFTRFTC